MATLPALEISCSYTVVETVPLDPFAWAILRALRAFPRQSRPSFAVMSEKLQIGDVSFLERGWAECVSWNLLRFAHADAKRPIETEPSDAASDAFFWGMQNAETTWGGDLALSRGYLTQGTPTRRADETLYFLLHDGAVVNWKPHFTVTNRAPTKKPKWAEKLTRDHLAAAIAAQFEDSSRHISASQQIEFLEPDWNGCNQVVISTDRRRTEEPQGGRT